MNAQKEYQELQSWPELIPLGGFKPDLPPFPLEALPPVVGNFVECLAAYTQTPESMAGTLALGVLSTIFQGRFTVEVSRGWKEVLCLYCLAVAPPGERKSAVFSALTRPLEEYEDGRRATEAAAIAENEAEKAILQNALKAAQSAAVSGGRNKSESARQQARQQGKEEALALAAELAAFQDMHPFRLLVDDVTPEKLAELMEQQGGCMTIRSSEGGLFAALRGRYDSAAVAANLDVYLKAHDGERISVDRISRGSNYISNPRLTLILALQPIVLQELLEDKTFRRRGLVARMMIALAESIVGRRKIDPDPIPLEIDSAYRNFVLSKLAEAYSGVLQLSDGANDVRRRFQAEIEPKLAPDVGDWAFMADFGGKLTGTAVRIAALLHCAQAVGDPTAEPISTETMEAAVKIADFFAAQAEAVYRGFGLSDDEDTAEARYVLSRLCSVPGDEITASKFRDSYCKRHFSSVKELETVLDRLAAFGYIKTERPEKNGPGRSPSLKIIFNPRWDRTI